MKKTLLLCVMGIGVFAFADFSRSDAGVVTDSNTNLQWQDEYKTDTNTDGNFTYTTWQGAIDYCEALELDGGNWRLPNINEALTIVNYAAVNPAIYNKRSGYGTGFQQFATANVTDDRNPPEYVDKSLTEKQRQLLVRYWTSTTAKGDNTRAWYVNGCRGLTTTGTTGDPKADSHVVRCVRGPATPK